MFGGHHRLDAGVEVPLIRGGHWLFSRRLLLFEFAGASVATVILFEIKKDAFSLNFLGLGLSVLGDELVNRLLAFAIVAHEHLVAVFAPEADLDAHRPKFVNTFLHPDE